MMKEYTPHEAALCLLKYLQGQDGQSACIDGFSTYLREHCGIGWDRTEFLLYHMEQEKLIVYLGKDRYWIRMTEKGKEYLKNENPFYRFRKTWWPYIKIVIYILGGLASIIGIAEGLGWL